MDCTEVARFTLQTINLSNFTIREIERERESVCVRERESERDREREIKRDRE